MLFRAFDVLANPRGLPIRFWDLQDVSSPQLGVVDVFIPPLFRFDDRADPVLGLELSEVALEGLGSDGIEVSGLAGDDLPDLGLPRREGYPAPRFDHELGHAHSPVVPRGESRPRGGAGKSGLRPAVDLSERGVYPEGFAEPVVREFIPDESPEVLEAHLI